MEQPVRSSKRRRSPSPPNHHGRPTRSAHKGKSREGHRPLRDLFSYQEIFLRILSFLPPTDLASVQSVNKHWSRMTSDPQLWRRLYLSRYPHPHASRLIYRDQPDPTQSSESSTPARSRRRISRLPSRAFPPPSPSRTPSRSSVNGDTPGSTTPLAADADEGEVGWGVRNDGVDWKMMLRLETNWSNGNALSETTLSLPPSPSPTISSDRLPEPSGSTSPPTQSQQHIALSPTFIFTSDPTSPLVQVHRASPVGSWGSSSAGATSVPLGIIPPPPGWSSPHRPDNITCICTDQSVSLPHNENMESTFQAQTHKPSLPTRLAVFYHSGGFVLLYIRLEGSRLVWKRDTIHPPSSRPRSIRRRNMYLQNSGDPVVLASLHYPVVVACSLSFHVSAYIVVSTNVEPSRPLHLSTMHSDVSFHPAALTLIPDDHDLHETRYAKDEVSTRALGPRHFRASLTYCTPLYPSSWTVAVQEFSIDLNRDLSDGTAQRRECFTVIAPDDDFDDLVWPRHIKPVIGVKGRRAVGVGADGRWCVLAGNDNQIQVYSLPAPSSYPVSDYSHNSEIHASKTAILHSQTLLAHSSAVTSLSLLSGRCVSGGRDGRVLVWELDGDDHDAEGDGRRGRTVGYVEVKRGGRRNWQGASGPPPPPLFDSSGSTSKLDPAERLLLPHPASISSAARSLFLPRPPGEMRPRDDRPPPIRQLAFDEEKIVGLVREDDSVHGGRGGGEMMKVWSFNS